MSKSKTRLTADHLLKDYRDLERKLGKQPTSLEYGRKCHSISSVANVLGRPGWRKLLGAAGAKPYRRFSQGSVQDCYRRLKTKLGRVPFRREFEQQCCSYSTLHKLFGSGAWGNLLRSVGDYRGSGMSRLKGPSKISMLSAYRSLRKRLGKAPNLKQYEKATGYSLKDLRFRFGENAWRELIRRSKDHTRAVRSNLTAKHLIQDFLELQQELGRRPSISEYLFKCHTPKVLDRVFGKPGWKNMIAAAGTKALPKNVISASHLVDDYVELYRRLGRNPVFEEFKRMQHHTIKVLDRAFGRPGWSNLVSAAQKKMLLR